MLKIGARFAAMIKSKKVQCRRKEMSDALSRFLKYVKINTQSARDSTSYPSTERQFDLAKVLVEELQEIGLEDVKLDQFGYVTATLPANTEKSVPVVGFLAHMDTSPDASGENVQPRVVTAYDGGDIILNKEKNIVLSPREFPQIAALRGDDLVVTDGTTLLGADDKAGVAAIMSAMAQLKAHPEIRHGKIRVAFTPDEEVGAGVDHFDVPAFGADFAFTVDGGELGELEYENFNAAEARVRVSGRSVHPGSAKGTMINAAQIALEFHQLLPPFEKPENTAGREGFIHLFEMSGDVENAALNYIIRDHDEALFEKKKEAMRDAADFLNKRFGSATVSVEIRDQYYNMRKMIEPHPEVLDAARKAYRDLGIEPREIPVRGGTDGSRLSYMGLPTPNLFTGGGNYHGRFEYLSVKGLNKASEVVVRIAELVGQG